MSLHSTAEVSGLLSSTPVACLLVYVVLSKTVEACYLHSAELQSRKTFRSKIRSKQLNNPILLSTCLNVWTCVCEELFWIRTKRLCTCHNIKQCNTADRTTWSSLWILIDLLLFFSVRYFSLLIKLVSDVSILFLIKIMLFLSGFFNTDVLCCLFFLVPSNDTCMLDTEWKQSAFFLDKCKQLLHYPANINFIVILPEDTHNWLIKPMLPENTCYLSLAKKRSVIFLHGLSIFLSLDCSFLKKNLKLITFPCSLLLTFLAFIH